MFGFLKRLITKPRHIEILVYEHPILTFKTEEEIDIGVVDIITEVEGEQIRGRIDVKELGLEKSTALWLEPQEAVPYLKELFPSYHEKRTETRLHRHLRVISKDLPGFKGTSLDISLHGARIEVSEPVPLGKRVLLNLDLDDAAGTTVEAAGEVRWCAPKINSPVALIGVHFDEMTGESEYAMRSFMRLLQEREKGNLGF